MGAELEPKIATNCGIEGLMTFYIQKLRIQSKLYNKMKTDVEKRERMLTIDLYVDKSKKLLVEIAKTHHSPAQLMIELAFINILK